MMNPKQDLETLDRATLRMWRISNIVGWGLAGLAAGLAVLVAAELAGFGLGMIAHTDIGIAPGAIIGALILGPVTAGILVGGHVYRWPGFVAASAWLLTAVPFVLRASSQTNDVRGAWVAAIVYAGVQAVLAGIVARWRWNRRPRALRA
jgi:hypothetical protein